MGRSSWAERYENENRQKIGKTNLTDKAGRKCSIGFVYTDDFECVISILLDVLGEKPK